MTTTIVSQTDAPLLVKLRKAVESHPYRSVLIAAAVGAGVGLALSSRLTRAVTFRVGTFAITELIEKYLREAINGRAA